MDVLSGCDTTITWEDVDLVLEQEIKTNHQNMKLMTSRRRLFAFITIYSFLHDFLTTRSSRESDEWCSMSVTKNLLAGVAGIIQILQDRVYFYERVMEKLSVQQTELDPRLLMSRLIERSDPDKKIWQRLHNANIAPEKVITAYKRVSHLLPNEAVANYEYRTGPAVLSTKELQQYQSSIINTENSF